jgi:hypothetical protein
MKTCPQRDKSTLIDPAHLVKKCALPITPNHQYMSPAHADSQQIGVTHPGDRS